MQSAASRIDGHPAAKSDANPRRPKRSLRFADVWAVRLGPFAAILSLILGIAATVAVIQSIVFTSCTGADPDWWGDNRYPSIKACQRTVGWTIPVTLLAVLLSLLFSLATGLWLARIGSWIRRRRWQKEFLPSVTVLKQLYGQGRVRKDAYDRILQNMTATLEGSFQPARRLTTLLALRRGLMLGGLILLLIGYYGQLLHVVPSWGLIYWLMSAIGLTLLVVAWILLHGLVVEARRSSNEFLASLRADESRILEAAGAVQ